VERPTTFDEVEEGARRRAAIVERTTEITQSYLDAIGASLLGSPDIKGRRQRIGLDLHYKQKSTRPMPPHNLEYSTDTSYRQARSAGRAALKHAHAFEALVKRGVGYWLGAVKLDFPKQQLRTLEVKTYWGPKAFLGNFLDKNHPLFALASQNIQSYHGFVKLGLEHDNLFVETKSEQTRNKYVYNPEQDCFVHVESKGPATRAFGKSVSVEQYLQMLEGGLALLPVERVFIE